MIFYTADLDRRHLVIFRAASDVRPNSIFDIGKDESRSVLCTENEMVETLGVCIRHYSCVAMRRLLLVKVPWVKTHG
jgi:hypothetical protein